MLIGDIDEVYSATDAGEGDLVWYESEFRLKLGEGFFSRGAKFAAFKHGSLVRMGQHEHKDVLVKMNRGLCGI